MNRVSPSQAARSGFLIHLTVYLLVNALLLGINLTYTPAQLWFVWPLAGWGIGLGAHAAAYFSMSRRSVSTH